MARIAGVDLPRDKRVEIGLTSIYGIGRMASAAPLQQQLSKRQASIPTQDAGI